MNIVLNEGDESNDLFRIVSCTAPSNQILSVIGKPLFKEDEDFRVDLLKEGFRSANYAELLRGVVDAPKLNGQWSLVDHHGVRIMRSISTSETDEEDHDLVLFLDYDENEDNFSFLLMEDESCELEDITSANKYRSAIENAMESIEIQLLTLIVDAGLRAHTLNKDKVLKAIG